MLCSSCTSLGAFLFAGRPAPLSLQQSLMHFMRSEAEVRTFWTAATFYGRSIRRAISCLTVCLVNGTLLTGRTVNRWPTDRLQVGCRHPSHLSRLLMHPELQHWFASLVVFAGYGTFSLKTQLNRPFGCLNEVFRPT